MSVGELPNISRQHTLLIFKGRVSIFVDRQVGRKLMKVKHVCMSNQTGTSSFFHVLFTQIFI